MSFSLKNAYMKFKLRNNPLAERCQHCGRIAVNNTAFPFAFCTQGHSPMSMRRIRK